MDPNNECKIVIYPSCHDITVKKVDLIDIFINRPTLLSIGSCNSCDIKQTVTIKTPPQNGCLCLKNSLTLLLYTPHRNYCGDDFFIIELTDDCGRISQKTVFLNIISPC